LSKKRRPPTPGDKVSAARRRARAAEGAAARAPAARRAGAGAPARDWRRPLGVSAVALALLGFVYGVVFTHLWYGFHDISDVSIYFDFAGRLAAGFRPYIDFALEYPPLAVPLFTIPGHTGDMLAYMRWFSAEMMALVAVTTVVVAITATSLWRGWPRPLVAVAVFALSVAATGAIIANRYDATVGLVLALCLLFLARRWWPWAALILGLGFALKLTPAILLPLVLVLAARRRIILLATVYFVLAAVLPWVPYLTRGREGLEYVFTYHMDRPLQVESVLATPHWIGFLADRVWVEVGTSYGSQFIRSDGAGTTSLIAGLVMAAIALAGLIYLWWRRDRLDGDATLVVGGLLAVVGVFGGGLLLAAASTHTIADISLWIAGTALTVVYALIWRRRETLRAEPRLVPLAVLAVILAFMTFGKVLSPQYFIWVLPVIALVAIERRLLGALCVVVVLLTQIEFPTQYWPFIEMDRGAVALVVLRNLTLLSAFLLSLAALARLPDARVSDR
jgi:hypothetical protein